MPEKITMAVIGVGHLGQHHARLLASHPNALLVGVVDSDFRRAQGIAKKYSTQAYQNIEEILPKVQAVTIATPTPTHHAIGKAFLSAGIPCLIEKPIASSLSEAEELLKISQQNNVILQVGHVERFNPAVEGTIPYVQDPKFIEVSRLGPYDPRVSHIGVVLDLMIHDIDIVLELVKSPVESLEAFGTKVLSEHEDIAKVRLRFKNGCVADLSASRVSLEKFRKIRIFQPNSYISVDYAGGSVKIYRKMAETVRSLRDIEFIKPKLSKQEPLAREIGHFLQCLRTGQQPVVNGQQGRNALHLALEILAALKKLS